MKPREFHIWDFPEYKVRILFRNQDEFVQKAISHFGNRKKLGDFLNIRPIEIYNWIKYKLYIPLKYVKLIINELELNWTDVEKKISSYKGVNTSTSIINPNLPIKERPEVFSIITHIICDGSVNKNGIPIYTNMSKKLIDNLDKNLRETFGDFDFSLYFGSGTNKNCYQYRFPKIFIELIEHFYSINFHKKKEIPKVIFDLPNEFSIAVVKAFADDEGSVDLNWRISFNQKDKAILSILQKLLKEKLDFSHLSEIMNKDNCSLFYIKSMEIEKYQKEIGFTHPNKAKILDEIVGWRAQSRGRKAMGETREKLLKVLNDKILSTYDIMRELKVNKSNINSQIKQLIQQGLIIQHHKIGQTVFWAKTMEKK